MTLHFRTRRLVIFGKNIDVLSSFSDVLDDPTVGWRREKSGTMGTQITDLSGIQIVVKILHQKCTVCWRYNFVYTSTEFGEIRVGNLTTHFIFMVKLPHTSFSLL